MRSTSWPPSRGSPWSPSSRAAVPSPGCAMRRWRCARSTGISCADCGRCYFLSSTSIDDRHEAHAVHVRPRRRLAGRAILRPVLRHVRQLVRTRRSGPARVQLEHPLPHGGALHALRGRRRMALLRPSASRRAPARRRRRARLGPPQGARRGDGRSTDVSHAAVAHEHVLEPTETPLTPESWGKLGMWIFLCADAMSFGGPFFILTGFHGCHVFSGVVYLSAVLARALAGAYSVHQNNGVEIAALYWHFVDLIWILVFTFVYLL